MPNIHGFEQAMKAVAGSSKKHLLLGNGFSIALKPDIFTYGSLYDNADFSKSLQSDSAAIKDALVSAIAKRHPDRPQGAPKF